MGIQKVLTCIILCFHFSGYAQDIKTTSDTPASNTVLSEFSIPTQGDIILLPVKFKGKEYAFVLDTGTSVTTFDTSLKNELGSVKKIAKIETGTDPINVQLFDAPEAFLGPLNLQNCGQVTCVDLKTLGYVLGKEINGVLGMNFLQKYIVQMNFDEGKLIFMQSIVSPRNDWGEAFTITLNTLGHPYVKGSIIDSINVDFLIDTGQNISGGVDAKIYKTLPKNSIIKTTEAITQTPSGATKSIKFRINNLSIGSLKYENLLLNVSDASSLGISFLSRHKVTFDFPGKKIYLSKGRYFEKTDEADMSGLHLLLLSDQTVVHSVDDSSPAEKAGIMANDVILSVQNKEANKYDMQELRRFLMSGDRDEIKMVIKRGKDTKELSFMLEKKI
jgi:hypothetical protein